MTKKIEVLPDKQALLDYTLNLVTDKIREAIAARGQCTIALSGGGTPEPLYAAIAQRHAQGMIATQSLPWEKIHVFWGDERYVPPDHIDSNQGMARKAWLDQVNIPAANIHPMPTTGADPVADAQKHAQELQAFFQLQPGEFPVFDIILLGIGDDGHTASLFPHTEALQISDRLVTVGNKDGQPRITFTYTLINHARSVIFLVAGASKQDALAHIFSAQADDFTYPARLIRPQGELWWLLDQSAGEQVNI